MSNMTVQAYQGKICCCTRSPEYYKSQCL